jgi:S-DNA-T family DNA segregation ATPase FtsK/SpoIIIE
MTTNEEILQKLKILELRIEAIEHFLSSFESFASADVDDTLLPKAIEVVQEYDRASASLLQRRLSIGYARAARILDQLEEKGIVGKGEGAMPREVIKK